MTHRKLVILGTGGTIAGTADHASNNIGYTAAQVGIEQLLAGISGLGTDVDFTSEQVCQIDSKDMDFDIWDKLASRVNHFLADEEVQGIVITHGTDTLEETAYFLQIACRPAKPVVLTCAMRPATALTPDGPQNVLDSVAVARCPGASGVVVVCAGTVHSAFDVQKVHTYKVDAFNSGDSGPIGYVEEGRLRLLRNWPGSQNLHEPVAIHSEVVWPRVEIILSHAGASALWVQSLVKQGIRGLVVAGTGNGTVHHALLASLLEAQAAGIRVTRSTRCLDGRVMPIPGDSIADSKGLSPVKARIMMMLELMAEDGLALRAKVA